MSFKLLGIVGYAKGKFKKSANIFEDLATAFYMDDYDSSFLFNKKELAELLLRKVTEANLLSSRDYCDLILELNPKDSIKYGYWVEETQFCQHEAIVRSILSKIMLMTKDQLGWDEWPDLDRKASTFDYIRENKSKPLVFKKK
jgi:hypothetical protein